MSGRIVYGLWLMGVVLALAGCGGGGEATSTTTTTQTTETTAPETTSLRVYFLLHGKVQPVAREVPRTQAVLTAAMEQLLAGPTRAERKLGLTSGFQPGGRVLSASVKDGVASIGLDASYDQAGVAQLVYTATQFPSVKAVSSGQETFARSDFEDFTPQILVESPLPFATVSSPIRATGTANTFEATFQYDVVGPDGTVLATHYVTATSGSGTRGTFDFTTEPFSASGDGALVVYELSAKDGSRIHEVRIPVHFAAQK